MKPINEMTLSECLEALCEKHLVDEHPIPVYKNDRQDLADRIHELTRWIPVEELLPDDREIEQVSCDEMQQDWAELVYMGIYKDGFVDGAKWMKSQALSPNRKIDKPEEQP